VARSETECSAILTIIRNHCEKYGKNLESLISSWQGFITTGRTESDVSATVERTAKTRGQSVEEFRKTAGERGAIIGTPDHCVERLRRMRDLGINHFMLIFSDDTSLRPLELFRDQVIPELK